MITLYFVRHGQTVWNESGRYQGSTEVALSALGKEQAKLTAHWFEEIFLNGIISSSLGRAMDCSCLTASLLPIYRGGRCRRLKRSLTAGIIRLM